MLIDPQGKPLASDDSMEAAQARAVVVLEAAKGFLDENKVTLAELLDLTVNLFSLWCSRCPATMYQQQVTIAMAAFTQTFQNYVPMKQGELKIRENMKNSNPGAGITQ